MYREDHAVVADHAATRRAGGCIISAALALHLCLRAPLRAPRPRGLFPHRRGLPGGDLRLRSRGFGLLFRGLRLRELGGLLQRTFLGLQPRPLPRQFRLRPLEFMPGLRERLFRHGHLPAGGSGKRSRNSRRGWSLGEGRHYQEARREKRRDDQGDENSDAGFHGDFSFEQAGGAREPGDSAREFGIRCGHRRREGGKLACLQPLGTGSQAFGERATIARTRRGPIVASQFGTRREPRARRPIERLKEQQSADDDRGNLPKRIAPPAMREFMREERPQLGRRQCFKRPRRQNDFTVRQGNRPGDRSRNAERRRAAESRLMAKRRKRIECRAFTKTRTPGKFAPCSTRGDADARK